MFGDKQTIHTTALALTSANTEYQLSLPAEAQNIRLKLADATKTWRYSSTIGLVASSAAGTCPVAAGAEILLDGPISGQVLYIAGADASQTLTVSYSRPTRCG